MSDALASASASFEVLQRQLNDCTNNVEQLQRVAMPSRTNDGAAVSASVTALMVRNIEMLYLVNFFFCFFLLFNLASFYLYLLYLQLHEEIPARF